MLSVCIATHNGEEFIKEQIDSIIPQLGINDEIIISDDGSTDKTLEIVKNFKDNRIKIFNYEQPHNPLKGAQKSIRFATKNFENALSKTKGDIIFLCDQDDIWYPNKIEVCKTYLLSCDIVKHNYSLIDEKGMLIQESYYDEERQKNRTLYHLFKFLPFRGCCMAFKRDLLYKALPFPKNCLQHDTWIGMIARIDGLKFNYINQPLIYHRHHRNNASELTVPNSIFYKLKYRFSLISQLIRYHQ